ncbi:MAG: holo-ACP synthase [Planctomycetes bacterium]|nr:holo-ACP synthase [Planctomycetota bacterium]MCC7398835.1 holo-ACP synthase [Planctomycetota bacterium]
MVNIGVDSVDIDRIEGLLQRSGARFLARVFTTAEAAYCGQRGRPAASLAVRFAAKEAVMKCLGTGWAQGIGFGDIEVVRAPSGAVAITLHGAAQARALQLGIRRVHLSLSHTDTVATAFAVAEG